MARPLRIEFPGAWYHVMNRGAGLVHDLADYRWSSYRAYAGFEAAPGWLTTRCLLNAVGRRDRHKRYIAYVGEESDEALVAFYSGAKMSPILGGARFKAKVLAGGETDIDRPELRAARVLPSLQQIVGATCRCFGVEEVEIWRSRRGRGALSPARQVAMYLCQRIGDMRLSEIARIFKLSSYGSAGR